jgi:hypothetical protein
MALIRKRKGGVVRARVKSEATVKDSKVPLLRSEMPVSYFVRAETKTANRASISAVHNLDAVRG